MKNYNVFFSRAVKKHNSRTLKIKYSVKGVDTPLYESNDKDKEQFLNWEQAYQRNIAKITTMILLFVFSNDDDTVSRKEFKIFKKFFKAKDNLLTASDFKELKEMTMKRFSVQSFIDYMYKNEYQEKIFLDAVVESKKIIQKFSKYLNLIDDLENQYHS